jgi:hypothetical protein
MKIYFETKCSSERELLLQGKKFLFLGPSSRKAAFLTILFV